MADIIYLTLNGNKQGLISAGCSSYDSIGNRYQNNHSDEILVYSTDYDISRHQNISHAPFVFEKANDKSSALLLSSITNMKFWNVILNIIVSIKTEGYYTIKRSN
ncbi:type VI secretion system tube protein TssD [Proteus mirabilis]|uniref:type VI secretion system tube protein TssD n=1 Tax=Proteus mirabilis TaxID=584 RepID=UPI0009402975|nr:type VI secretion system tube protein TssD [Proteus mirabilis]